MKRMRRKTPKSPKSKQALRRRPINVLASGMTVMGLYMGTASIFSSIEHEYKTAAFLILGAIFFDMFDGTVAKLTKTTSEFGKQLDSLCDLVDFGVAPAVLVYNAYQMYTPQAGSFAAKTGSLVAIVAIVYVICAALRLARFNVYQADQRDWFEGLPSPAAGGTVATFVLFLQYFESSAEYYILGMMTLLLAGVMVSTVRYPKDRMKSFAFAPKHAVFILGAVALAIALVHYAITISPAIVLFPVAFAYVLFGIADTVHFYWQHWHSERAALAEEADSEGQGAPGGRRSADASR
ncbi:MAG: CDP-diacylglycerol--serine O-phosphatidyltransferase [Candidatus Hydrogenedentes bacterium]|nr:CDP-diacylglycerol--serine O-phosphatidyltransferase [Candidatus Hydrogenedentota bacterium]